MEYCAKVALEKMTLEEKIGQMLVTGFPDGEMNTSFLQLVRDVKVGNVILFRENQLSRGQLERLCEEIKNYIQSETGIAPFITSDEEGGIVSRLPEDLGKMPSAMAFSKMKSKKAAYQAAYLSGRQLKRLGINFNLAPVLDINNNIENPVIGVRSYGQTAQEVCDYAGEAVKGYMDAGIMCVGKHFPGHGDTNTDSHLDLPVIKKSIDEMWDMELLPFVKAIDEGIPAMTIAHVVFEKEDSLPATMSKKLVDGLLREKMHFDGLIISDCMEMNAISRHYGIEEGTVKAINAGIDLIFISHFHDKVRSTAARIIEAVKSGEISEQRIDEAVSRILYYKGKYIEENKSEKNSIYSECMSYAAEVYDKAVFEGVNSYLLDSAVIKKISIGESPLFLSPKKQQISMVSNLPEMLSFADELQKTFGGRAMSFEMNLSDEMIERLVKAAEGATSVIVGTLNASIYKGQTKLLQALSKLNIPVACAALRDPFDLEHVSDNIYKIPLYEYTYRSIETAKKYFEV